MSLLACEPMAKKAEQPDRKDLAGEKKTTTKVSDNLMRQARTVAVQRGIDLYDYIDSILRPVIEEDYSEIPERIQKETKGN